MKKFMQSILVTLLTFLMLQPVFAQADEVTLAEYKDLLVRYSIMVGAHDVTEKLDALTNEEWQQLYDATPSKGKFVKAITDLEKLIQDDAAKSGIYAEGLIMPLFVAPSVTVPGEFEPRYPDWSGDYLDYMDPPINPAQIELFEPDGDENGFQDDRCKENAEAMVRKGHIISHGLAIAAAALCDAAPLETNVAACPLAGVNWGLDFALESMLEACEVQTGNVDSAEIEAAYENTRTILNEANNMVSILNDEENFTEDVELAAHETAVKAVISSQNTAINAQLTAIMNKLTEQQAQIDEIINLLNTPQGKRSDWNH